MRDYNQRVKRFFSEIQRTRGLNIVELVSWINEHPGVKELGLSISRPAITTYLKGELKRPLTEKGKLLISVLSGQPLEDVEQWLEECENDTSTIQELLNRIEEDFSELRKRLNEIAIEDSSYYIQLSKEQRKLLKRLIERSAQAWGWSISDFERVVEPRLLASLLNESSWVNPEKSQLEDLARFLFRIRSEGADFSLSNRTYSSLKELLRDLNCPCSN